MTSEFKCPTCGKTFYRTTGYTKAQFENMVKSGQPIPDLNKKAPFKCPLCGNMIDPSDPASRPPRRLKIMMD